MTFRNPAETKQPRFLRARRLVLLASVAGLGAVVFLAGPGGYRPFGLDFGAQPARAEASLPHPAGFADIVAQVKPAVISVRVKFRAVAAPAISRQNGEDEAIPYAPGTEQEQTMIGEGSGFIISADGYAVTNNHVVEHAKSVQVTTDDGTIYTARVIGTDPKSDIALIKIDGRTDFPHVSFADQAPHIGDWVIAVGNPFGLGGTVTAGIVSARGRDIGTNPYDDYIQIDAPINKGNSGGPAFNVEGQVIGINTAIYSPSGGSVGIGFDIPAATAKLVVAQLKASGHVTRGWLGVQIQPVTAGIADSLGLKKAEGALVDEPQDGSPAAHAGIQSGDIIVAVNGAPVRDARELARTIAAMAPASSIRLDILRNGATKTLSVTLGQMPNES